MYKILVDGQLLCDSRVDDLAIVEPVVSLIMNASGSFDFTIPPDHPKYDIIQRRSSVVSVYLDDDQDPIFQGMAMSEAVDIFKQKTVHCEGELSYFNDSILRPAQYKNVTPLQLLTSYIAQHNSQVESKKRFEVGRVTVSGNINCYTNMNSTMTEIKEDLIDDFGGYMMVRYANGRKYIDYLADAPRTATQLIELGKNLTDYKSNIDDMELATRIIPLGANQEEGDIPGLETALTIASVNDGKDYLQSDAAVANFGLITKTVTFNEVTVPSILKTKGQKYLDEIQFENVVVEASAIDFGYISDSIPKFKIMDYVHIKSEPHGMDKWFILTKMTLNLNSPENDRFTFGKSDRLSLSARTMAINSDIMETIQNVPTVSFVQQAIEQATALITGSEGGFVRFNYAENGEPYEILVMDTDDITTAKKVWRWNQNGFGFSSNGYGGPYGTAITMDGKIVADFINAGTMRGQTLIGAKCHINYPTIGGKEFGTDGFGFIDFYDANHYAYDGDGHNQDNPQASVYMKYGEVEEGFPQSGFWIESRTDDGNLNLKGGNSNQEATKIVSWSDFYHVYPAHFLNHANIQALFKDRWNNTRTESCIVMGASGSTSITPYMDFYSIVNSAYGVTLNYIGQICIEQVGSKWSFSLRAKQGRNLGLYSEDGLVDIVGKTVNEFADDGLLDMGGNKANLHADELVDIAGGAVNVHATGDVLDLSGDGINVHGGYGEVDIAGDSINVHSANTVDIAGYDINIHGGHGAVDIAGAEVTVDGMTFDLNTENTSDTWIPVMSYGYLQHTTIESIISRGASGLIDAVADHERRIAALEKKVRELEGRV